MAAPIAIVAYLALFVLVGFVFLFANLVVGYFLRPRLPNVEKLEVYECGEPVIGSSFVQFDLRFYVVALLFIIFDVEVAFFFPWATVFGKATQLTAAEAPLLASELDPARGPNELSAVTLARHRELGLQVSNMPTLPEGDGVSADPAVRNREALRQSARRLAATSFADIGVFFAVLMVGFAYVWKRGDLDWVRTMQHDRRERAPPPARPRPVEAASSILSA